METTIIVEYDDERTAEAVARAVSPDNHETPATLTIATIRKKNMVITTIEAKGTLATFVATIDDLLSSVSLAEKTLKEIQSS